MDDILLTYIEYCDLLLTQCIFYWCFNYADKENLEMKIKELSDD